MNGMPWVMATVAPLPIFNAETSLVTVEGVLLPGKLTALPLLAFPLTRRTRLERGEPFFRMQEVEGEPNSETRIDVIDRIGPLWRYALEPVTGRKHQLRVHMAALGAPIRNDASYPLVVQNVGNDYTRPLQLLARSLRFVDPLSGIERAFDSRLALDDVSP